jgi:protein-tyrosine phosphatase
VFSIFSTSSYVSVRPGEVLHADFHNHILPGIDDGAKTPAESLQMIDMMVNLGYRMIVSTPHAYQDMYPNTVDTILAAYDSIRQEVALKHPTLDFRHAAEYYLDENFEKLLEEKTLLPFRGKEVLVEQSFFAPYRNMDKILFQMQLRGYTPVLAHPERYAFYHNSTSEYETLIGAGAKFQVNLLSLHGRYGKETKQQAELLLENGWATYLGTDAHKPEHLQQLSGFKIKKKLLEKMEACAVGD